MTTNADFLNAIKKSFAMYLETGTSRSTAKLKPLHGQIARDLSETYGSAYTVESQGYGDDVEAKASGRYYDKKVDIAVTDYDLPIATYGVKFVMRNYSQNGNNYFENMLGETANLRAGNIPCFQIVILFDKVPHFKRDGSMTGYDKISGRSLSKYAALSKDDPGVCLHVPDLMLVCVVKLKEKSADHLYSDEKEYAAYYKSALGDEDLMAYSSEFAGRFGKGVILNDYEKFVGCSTRLAFGQKNGL